MWRTEFRTGKMRKRQRNWNCQICLSAVTREQEWENALARASHRYLVDHVGRECRTGWVSLWSDPMASSAFCVCPWQEKVEERKALIVSGYERRRQAMAEEEQLLLRQLQDEEQETLKKLQMNWAFLLGQSTRLRDLISEMEQKCQQPAASLLKVRLYRMASPNMTLTKQTQFWYFWIP